MVFIVALHVPWCRHLESLPDVKPQLYSDNLKCSAARPRASFESASFTAQYVRSVGQDVSPGKCVLLSTSKTVRKAMKLWDISGDGGFGKVQLDVRDLGGHIDFTFRAGAGTLSKRIGEATVGVAAVGALPLGFQVKLGLVRGKYLPAGLHVFPLLPLVLLGLRLFVQFGPLRCLLLMLLPFLRLYRQMLFLLFGMLFPGLVLMISGPSGARVLRLVCLGLIQRLVVPPRLAALPSLVEVCDVFVAGVW